MIEKIINIKKNKDQFSHSFLICNMWCFRIYSGNPFNIHGCRRASLGVSRSYGHQAKHRLKKSKKFSLLVPMISLRVFEAGFRSLPFLFGLILGWKSWKNFFDLQPFSRTSFGGIPNTSINIAICSYSSSPGNNGYPVKS